MKHLFRIIKILIVSVLTIFLISVTVSYLLLNVPSVQREITRIGEAELARLLGARLTIGSSHVYPFNRIQLSDVCLYDQQGDSLLYAQKLIAGVALQELFRKRLVFTNVQLYDFKVSLRRDSPSAPLNLQFIVDRFKKEGNSSIDIHSQINTILARRGEVLYNIDSAPRQQPGVFDPHHIAVRNFLATVSLKSLSRDSINVNIRKISFDEQSGFSLLKFGAKLIGNRESVVLSNFRITLPHTDISMKKTSTDFLSYDNLNEFFQKSTVDVHLEESHLMPADFGAFIPRLKNVRQTLNLETHLQGTPDNLSGNLRIDCGNELHLSAEAVARNLSRPAETFFSGKVNELNVSSTLLPLLLQEIIPERPGLAQRFMPLGAWQFSGQVDKTGAGLNADGRLLCELGEIDGNVNMNISTGQSNDVFTLNGELTTTNFGIGKFFAVEPLLGDVALDIKLNLNQHTRGGDLWGRIEGEIDHVDFKGYTYRNIILSGNYNNTNYDGIVSIDDPNGKLHLIGTIDLFDTHPLVRVFAEGQDIRLGALNLAPQYAESKTSFNITSNFYGNHIDNIEGEIVIDTLSFENEGKVFSTGQFTITAEHNDSIKRLHVASDVINGGLEGDYSFKHLKNQLVGLLSQYLPDLATESSPINGEKTDKNNFRYGFTVENSIELSSTLNLPITLQEQVQISGFFDGDKRRIGLNVYAPDLQFNSKHLFNNEINIENNDSIVNLSLRTQTYNKKGQYTGFSFDTEAKNNHILSRINWSNNSDTTFCGEISTLAHLAGRDSTVDCHINVLPTRIIIGDSIWQVNPATIDIVDGKGRIEGIEVHHKEQYLHIDGEVSKDPSDNLNLSLNDIRLDYIFDALNLKNVVFGGQATGDIIIADLLNGTPRLSTKEFAVKDFSYNHATFGDLSLFSRWDNENRGIFLNGTVSQPNYPDTQVNGYIFPTRDSLNLHFDAQHISLAFLNPFTEKILKNVDGHATGKINFYGRFKALNVEGSALVDRFGFGIDYLNTRFYISDSIRLTPDAIIIDNMTLAGEDDHLGKVNGIMRHKHFKNIEYTLSASDINNMLVYNTTEKQNAVYYGKVYGSGSVSIEGNTQYTGIDINMITNDRSKFTFVLSDNAEAEEYQFITFVDRSRDFHKSIQKEERPPLSAVLPETSSHLLSLNLQIDVNPQMSMNLLMDPATGDMIHATGSGNIRLEYNTFSDMKLYGTYTVEKGNYNFSLQDLITKDFIIKTGSSISFSGAPQNANLNIEAYYALTANLEDLDESFATEPDLNRTTIPVRALLFLTGNLQQPDFRFDLEFPTVTQDIDRRIRSIISTDDMVNRQIIYLLALSKFYTPDYMNVGQTRNNELVSVASSALSSQLNNLLGQINENVNIGTNLRSDKGDFSDVEVEVALSSQLLNNRLIINGNIGYRDNAVNNNTFIGDFDLEYLLNKSGNIRLKAYNHYNDKNYYIKSALTTQGVGIMYRKEFNKWSEWFSWLRRRKNKTEQQTP